jgi:hypothetical protein
MDHQSYISPNMLYQTNEPEANELTFDLEEFISQYTMSSEAWDNNTTSSESAPQGMQPEYYSQTTPQFWDNENYEWMNTAADSFDMPLGDLPLTAAQSNLPSAASSLSNVFISFEEFEQFIYPSEPFLSVPSGSSSTSSALSDSSSPSTSYTTSNSQTPETQSPQPSPPSNSVFRCEFCAKTFDKRHELK